MIRGVFEEGRGDIIVYNCIRFYGTYISFHLKFITGGEKEKHEDIR